MAVYTVIPPARWIIVSVLAAMNILAITICLRYEMKQRSQQNCSFTTNSLRYTSISCIICGLITNILSLAKLIPGLCLFVRWLSNVFWYLQFLSMGFYQLSRLYYSFANSQVHSDKGYPKWVFIVMLIVPIVIMFIFSISNMFTVLNSDCGINSDFEYFSYPIKNPDETLTILAGFAAAWSYVIWDVITMLLYMFKIRMFKIYKTTEPIVYKRILSILYKIAIITLFYDICSLIGGILLFIAYLVIVDATWFGFIWTLAVYCGTLLYSVSMLLMMDYNAVLYYRFLRYIYKLKLYLCCCCCRHMVIEQLDALDADVQSFSIDEKKKVDRKKTANTEDIDETVKKIEQQGCELSVETKTFEKDVNL